MAALAACAGLTGLEPITYLDGSRDADGMDENTPSDRDQEAPDAEGDARIGVTLDDSDFCRAQTGAVFCRQFDDDAAADDGLIFTFAQGTIGFDDDAFSGTRSLRTLTTVNGGVAAFAGGTEPHLQSVRLTFRAKISSTESTTREFAHLLQHRCTYSLLTNQLVVTLVPDDGGAAMRIGMPQPFEPPISRDEWHLITIEVVRQTPTVVGLRVAVDETDVLKTLSDPCPSETKSLSGFILGVRGGDPIDIHYDDIVLSSVP